MIPARVALTRVTSLAAAWAALALPEAARAQTAPPVAPTAAPAAEETVIDADNDSPGYTPADGVGAPSPLQITGYVDIRLAHAG